MIHIGNSIFVNEDDIVCFAHGNTRLREVLLVSPNSRYLSKIIKVLDKSRGYKPPPIRRSVNRLKLESFVLLKEGFLFCSTSKFNDIKEQVFKSGLEDDFFEFSPLFYLNKRQILLMGFGHTVGYRYDLDEMLSSHPESLDFDGIGLPPESHIFDPSDAFIPAGTEVKDVIVDLAIYVSGIPRWWIKKLEEEGKVGDDARRFRARMFALVSLKKDKFDPEKALIFVTAFNSRYFVSNVLPSIGVSEDYLPKKVLRSVRDV